MVDNKEIMAKNIKRYMDLQKVSAVDVCGALDIKQNTFSDWVNAKTYPRIDAIEKMASYFNIRKCDLVEESSDKSLYNISDFEYQIILRFRESSSRIQDLILSDLRLKKETDSELSREA